MPPNVRCFADISNYEEIIFSFISSALWSWIPCSLLIAEERLYSGRRHRIPAAESTWLDQAAHRFDRCGDRLLTAEQEWPADFRRAVAIRQGVANGRQRFDENQIQRRHQAWGPGGRGRRVRPLYHAWRGRVDHHLIERYQGMGRIRIQDRNRCSARHGQASHAADSY